MRVLVENEWRDGFLDYYQGPDDVVIEVIANLPIEKIDGMYFERKKSVRLLWNYIFEIGVLNVVRKIISRSQEKFRNKKFLSIGLGKVLSKSSNSLIHDSTYVFYIATSHPLCVDRIVLPSEFVKEVDEKILPGGCKDKLFTKEISKQESLKEIVALKGWDSYSGEPVPDNIVKCLDQGIEYIEGVNWADVKSWPKFSNDYVISSDSKNRKASTNRKAVLYGYGNYAKTVIIPNIKANIAIDAIHEIDPLQIPLKRDGSNLWSTSPQSHSVDDFDAYLIAGYHHTHSQLAIEALNNNAYAVVEKPVVVDYNQLGILIEAMKCANKGLFSCFHKRYLPLNKYALLDFGFSPGEEPISYHCIVYEVPLPDLHWYKWPNSKSRLVSNGCHWLDHFLFLNDFSAPVDYQLFVAKDGTINCSVELDNKAVFSMVLTDNGSERIGVQDYIELRNKDITVVMKNGSEYMSESSTKVIRTIKINKMDSYKEMYKKISLSIANDEEGDSIKSLEVSSNLILALEAEYNELCGNH